MAVDLNQAYVASTAAASAARMADADLAWLEEPVGQHDYAGYARLSQSLTTPISGGESLASIEAMRTLLDEGKVSILQPDLSIAGGYGGLARIQAFADAAHVPIMPHVFGTAVNLFASLQFASLLEPMRSGHAHPYPFFEFDMMDNPLLALGGMLKVDADSCLAIPQGPGIGLEFEPERLEPWIDHSWRQET